MTGLRVRDTQTGDETNFGVTGVFVAIGHEPRSVLVRDASTSTRKATCWCRDAPTSTSVDGVFAAGDWWTTPIARRSPPPAVAAPRPSTPSAGCRTCRCPAAENADSNDT